jgi:hypothetical protein
MQARIAVLALSVVACSSAQAQPNVSSVVVARAPDAPNDDPLTRALRRCAVSDEQPARRVYFSWTTKEQADELARRKLLLTRGDSPSRGPAMFDVLLAADDSAPARFIRQHFTTRRFGWPSAWATVAGWEGETYGDQLIRIELADEAMVARFRPGQRAAWAFFEPDGRPIPDSTALEQLELLAVVHHTGSFREAVILNEAMVARWELATPDVAREIHRGIELMRQLEPRAPAAPALWAACLAFPNERYAQSAANLRRIRGALEAAVDAQGKSVEHHLLGDRKLAPSYFAPPPPPPARPARWCGTLACP